MLCAQRYSITAATASSSPPLCIPVAVCVAVRVAFRVALLIFYKLPTKIVIQHGQCNHRLHFCVDSLMYTHQTNLIDFLTTSSGLSISSSSFSFSSSSDKLSGSTDSSLLVPVLVSRSRFGTAVVTNNVWVVYSSVFSLFKPSLTSIRSCSLRHL